MRRNTRSLWLSLSLAAAGLAAVRGGEFTVKTLSQPPPEALAGSIRQALQPEAIQVLEDGKPLFTFWLRREVALKAKPASESKWLDAVKETTLMAAVKVEQPTWDYKDNELGPGLYTARLAILPSDGAHMGAADYPYFWLLVPASLDQELNGLSKYKDLVKASGKGTATEHPRVISLRPQSKATGTPPCITDPAPEHKAVRVQIQTRAPEAAVPSSFTFEIVVQGVGHL